MSESKSKKLSWLQICNELKLIGYNRKVVEMRFKENVLTLQQWKKKFEDIGLKF